MLAAVFQTRMFAFVAVLVIVVAVLFRNDFHFEFSCHGVIIPYFLVWRKGQDVYPRFLPSNN